jgi:hypothetical protein
MNWEIKQAGLDTAGTLCRDGWEPFAVTTVAGGGPQVFLRRPWRDPDEHARIDAAAAAYIETFERGFLEREQVHGPLPSRERGPRP